MSNSQEPSNTSSYDSEPDTLAHIDRVRELLVGARANLAVRGIKHDESKLQEPEKSGFDRCIPKLGELVYGSPEYLAALEDLKESALNHHYAHNSHHPEHYENGVDGMSLFDLLEMLVDWKAATERMKTGTGDIRRSLEVNAKRFNMSPQLVSIFANTIEEFGW